MKCLLREMGPANFTSSIISQCMSVYPQQKLSEFSDLWLVVASKQLATRTDGNRRSG